MNDTRVRDVMTNLVLTVSPNDSLADAAKRLTRNNISGAPVVEEGRIVGVVSEADLVRAALPPIHVDKGASLIDHISAIVRAKPMTPVSAPTVGDVMTHPAITISPDESIWKAAETMYYRDVKRLPVIDDEGFVIGIITRADVIKTMARTDAQLEQDVEDAILILGEDVAGDIGIEVRNGALILTGEVDRRSTRELTVKIASRVPGILDIHDRLTFRYDDSKFTAELMSPQPSEGLTVGSVVRGGEL